MSVSKTHDVGSIPSSPAKMFNLLVLDGLEGAPYKRVHIVQLNGGGPVINIDWCY